jgi:hypothetical protein
MNRLLGFTMVLMITVPALGQQLQAEPGPPASGQTFASPGYQLPALRFMSTIWGGQYQVGLGFNEFSPELLFETFSPGNNVISVQNDVHSGTSAYTARGIDSSYPTNRATTLICTTTLGHSDIDCSGNSVANGSLILGAGIPASPYTTVKSGGGTSHLVMSENATATNSNTSLTFSPPFEHLAIGYQDNGNPEAFIEASRFDHSNNRLLLPVDFRLFHSGGIDPTGGTTNQCTFTKGSASFSCTHPIAANGSLMWDGNIGGNQVWNGPFAVPGATTVVEGSGTPIGMMSNPAQASSSNDTTYFLNTTFEQTSVFEVEPIRYNYWYANDRSAIEIVDRGAKTIRFDHTNITIGNVGYFPASLYVDGDSMFGKGLTGADVGRAPVAVGDAGAPQIYASRPSVGAFQFEINAPGAVIPYGVNPEVDLRSSTGKTTKYGLAMDLNAGTVYLPSGLKVHRRTIGAGSMDTATAADVVIAWKSSTGSDKVQNVPGCAGAIDGTFYIIKDEQGDAGNKPIAVIPAGGTIERRSTLPISNNNGSVQIICDGPATNWMVVGRQ